MQDLETDIDFQQLADQLNENQSNLQDFLLHDHQASEIAHYSQICENVENMSKVSMQVLNVAQQYQTNSKSTNLELEAHLQDEMNQNNDLRSKLHMCEQKINELEQVCQQFEERQDLAKSEFVDLQQISDSYQTVNGKLKENV